MIDYENIRKVVCKGLKDYIQRPVIRQNQVAEIPEYPYVSYTITTLASENKGTYGQYDGGIQAKPLTQIWSITAQSDNDIECMSLISKCREWLDNVGTIYLNDNNVVVRWVGNITNRDNILTTDYEYRKGFDVTFAIADVVESKIETIENVEMNINGEQGGE